MRILAAAVTLCFLGNQSAFATPQDAARVIVDIVKEVAPKIVPELKLVVLEGTPEAVQVEVRQNLLRALKLPGLLGVFFATESIISQSKEENILREFYAHHVFNNDFQDIRYRIFSYDSKSGLSKEIWANIGEPGSDEELGVIHNGIQNIGGHEWLIRRLRQLNTLPEPIIDVRETAVSTVLLTARWAYKIAKPVLWGWLNTNLLGERLHVCQEEVRLGTRTARQIYAGIEPISLQNGQLSLGPSDHPIDYAVKMVNVSGYPTLESLIDRREATVAQMEVLGRYLAHFEMSLPEFSTVSGRPVSESIVDEMNSMIPRLEAIPGNVLTEEAKDQLSFAYRNATLQNKALVFARAEHSREGHGDLKLNSIYFVPHNVSTDGLFLLDPMNLTPEFRIRDSIWDIAGLFAQLEMTGDTELARTLWNSYMSIAHDREGEIVLPFYMAHKHLILAFVSGGQANLPTTTESEAIRLRAVARAHIQRAIQLWSGEIPAFLRNP